MKSSKTSSRTSRPARVAVRSKAATATPTRRSAPKAAKVGTVVAAAKKTKEAVTTEAWYQGKKAKTAAVVGAAAVLVGVGTLVRKLRA
jgi:hypothetical protein